MLNIDLRLESDGTNLRTTFLHHEVTHSSHRNTTGLLCFIRLTDDSTFSLVNIVCRSHETPRSVFV